MEPHVWSFIAVIVCALITASGVWWNNKINASRAGSQNQKDQVDSLRIAMEMAGMDLQEQLDLKKEVKELRELIRNGVIIVTHKTTVPLSGGTATSEITDVQAARVTPQPVAITKPVHKS